eukprot:jgi/Chrzof1/4896/Cz15g03150.t1
MLKHSSKHLRAVCSVCRQFSTTTGWGLPLATAVDDRDVLREVLSQQLDDIRAAGTFKVERIITSPQSASVGVSDRKDDVLNFCKHQSSASYHQGVNSWCCTADLGLCCLPV